MAHIQWKDRYNINFREIDAQHRGLLDLLNELIDMMDGRRSPDQVARIFHDLGEYAGTHFSSEERYMQAAKYPKLAEHRREHDEFAAKVQELGQAYDPGDPHLVNETLNFLKHWYLEHISKADQDYAPFLQRALPTASLQAVIFGLAGVLYAWDPAPLAQHLSKACAKPDAEVRKALLEDPGYLNKLESGALDGEGFCAEFSTWGGATLELEKLARAYADSFRAVPALLQLARGLKAKHQVALVGNGAPWCQTLVLPDLGCVDLFHAEVLSCDVGKRLPDSELLLETASLLKIPPEACLLIHSETACLDAAQAAHFQTLHYTKPVMLMAELRRMAIPF